MTPRTRPFGAESERETLASRGAVRESETRSTFAREAGKRRGSAAAAAARAIERKRAS
jgi:hypothetical protein